MQPPPSNPPPQVFLEGTTPGQGIWLREHLLLAAGVPPGESYELAVSITPNRVSTCVRFGGAPVAVCEICMFD